MMLHEKQRSDFVLSLDCKISKTCNSGIFVRALPLTPRPGKEVGFNGIEVRILDSTGSGYYNTGAIYDVGKPDVTIWPICLNSSTIRPAGLLDKITIAAETGYSAIELWNDDLTQFEQQGGSLSEIRQRLKDTGLTAPSIIALFDWMQSEGA